jgi:hypothetical protein
MQQSHAVRSVPLLPARGHLQLARWRKSLLALLLMDHSPSRPSPIPPFSFFPLCSHPAVFCVLLTPFCHAAITSSEVCAAAAGTWSKPACKVTQAPPCAAAGGSWSPRGMWTLEGGMDMLLVGLMQGALSYPFFDPVLTGVYGGGGGSEGGG